MLHIGAGVLHLLVIGNRLRHAVLLDHGGEGDAQRLADGTAVAAAGTQPRILRIADEGAAPAACHVPLRRTPGVAKPLDSIYRLLTYLLRHDLTRHVAVKAGYIHE